MSAFHNPGLSKNRTAALSFVTIKRFVVRDRAADYVAALTWNNSA